MQLPTKNTFKKIENNKYMAYMPNLSDEKTQKFTTTIFTILALIFFGIFAVGPTLSTIANLQKQIQDDQYVNQQLQNKINDLTLLQQKYGDLQNDMQAIYASVPKTSQIPLLIGQIQSLMKNNNLSIVNFQTFSVDVSNDLIQGKNYSSFAFTFTANGKYQDLINFVSQLNSMQRIIGFENISIGIPTGNQNNNQTGNNFLQISVRGDAYFKQ